MDYSLLIAYLRQKQYITDLEKDVLDTWDELQKSPFDRSSAQLQIMQNNAKHPEIFAAIKALPTTVIRPFDQVTKGDVGGVCRTAGVYEHCPFHGRWH